MNKWLVFKYIFLYPILIITVIVYQDEHNLGNFKT
jgi:hypothetical protein